VRRRYDGARADPRGGARCRGDILDAIRRVAGGGTVLSSDVQSSMAAELRLRRSGVNDLLSPREREILDLLTTGATTPEIAGQLFLSAATVKTHLHNLYEKLGVSDRAAAVAEGLRRGLIR
jgi:two-component system, NarL family, nitrate/nitrite response regulator NarL